MHKTVAVRHVVNTLSGRSMPIHSPEACTQHRTYQEKLANFLQRWAVLLQEALFRVMHIHRTACRLQAPFGETTSGAEACMLKEKAPLKLHSKVCTSIVVPSLLATLTKKLPSNKLCMACVGKISHS